ncbi:hypothetical protein VA599_19865 [Chromobacterium sp. TRC.1.1.SA]|uniref:THUMP domain-containing protein n=1 Tax=Chromobacterium indicum TaxID=3110228 RepID=A0ABV0CPH7_9NEIS
MKIYSMYSTEKSEFSLIDIKDKNGEIMDFFMLGLENERLKRTHFSAVAQSFFKVENINEFDYFEPTMAFPVFSEKAANLLQNTLKAQMETYKLKIRVKDESIETYAGRILNRKPVFERIDDYKIQVKKDFQIEKNDLIIRDINNPQFFFATELFKNTCKDFALKIKFKEFSLMK